MAGKIRKSNLHDDVKTMVTDMISEQALDSANFDSVLSSKTTDDITEGSTNQYYTSTRADSDFDARLATKTTGDISEGSNLYYTTSRADSDFDARLATKTTDNLTEGSNQYYTDSRADARIAAASLTDISDADQTVRTTDDVTFNNLVLTGTIDGPSTMYIDPAPVDSDGGLLVIRGNLQVDGTTTTINSTTVSINDKNIILADSAANAAEADGAGITVNGASATITYDAADDEWDFNKSLTVTDNNVGNPGGITIKNTNTAAYSHGQVKIESENGAAYSTIFTDAQNDVLRLGYNTSGSTLNINSSGNIGIGTTSPSAKLDVVSAGTGVETIAEFGNGNITKGLTIETDGNLDWGFNATNRNLTFSTSQTERMRITSGGNVVIGSDGGYTRGNLHIGASKSYASPYNYRDDTLLTIENFTSLEPAVLGFVADYAGSNRYGNIIWHPASSQGGSYFTINGDIQDVAHLVVTGDGDVGIGTASPNHYNNWTTLTLNNLSGGEIDFEVNGTLYADLFANSGDMFMRHHNGNIRFYTGGFETENERVRITSNGSVLVKNVATDASQFIFNDGWSAEARNIRVWAEEEVSGGIGRWFSFLGTNVSKDGDGTYTKPSDDASSNWGNIAGMLFTGANTAGQNAIDFVVDLPSAHGGGLNASMSGSDLYNKSAMSITADRKVGIGTRNPQQKLDIVDTNNPNIRIRRNYSLVNGNHIGYQDYYGNSVLYGYHGYWVENASTNASQFRLYTGSGGSVNQRLLITSTGRVNIGDQSTPTEGLEVYGTGGRDNIALKYSGTAGGHQSGYLWKDFRGQQNAGIYNNLQDDGVGTAAANMEFYTSHSGTVTKQMQIDRYGHITMPNQSAFRAYQTTDPTTDGYLTSGNSVSWSEQYDRNNDFSGGTFTAPVNGIYLFTVAWDDNGGNSGIDMWKNASTPVVRWEPDDPTGYAWQSRSWSTHIYLNANEYVQLYGRHSGSSTNPFHMGGGYWGWFSGMLVA